MKQDGQRKSLGWAPRMPLSLILALAAAALFSSCAPRAQGAAQAAAPAPAPAAGQRLAGADFGPAEAYPARPRSELPPAETPPRPAVTPGYAELDPESGLHMTGGPLLLDLASYRLSVKGRLRHPLSLDYDDLRSLAGIRQQAKLVCPGYFIDEGLWAGASLDALLVLAEPLPTAKSLTLKSADGYSSSVDLARARAEGFLAYGYNGAVLPILHGFPLRAVFPGQQGAKWVKWLVSIEVE